MGTRMGIQKYLFQARIIDMSIDFCRGNVFMAEQFLDVPKIDSSFQKMGSKGMTELVRGNMLGDPRLENFILNNEIKILSRHRFAQMGKKNEIRHLLVGH